MRVVAVDEHAVALDARRGRNVVRLRLADERMDQQPVDGLERDLGQVLVRAVDRVARLEADDALPAALRRTRPACRPGRTRAPGTAAPAARRPSPGRRGTSASARRGARRPDARRRSCRKHARPRATCRTRRPPATSSIARTSPRLVASATRSPLGASSTARHTGSAQGRPPAELHVVEHGLVVLAPHEALERRQRAATRSCRGRRAHATSASPSRASRRRPAARPCGRRASRRAA